MGSKTSIENFDATWNPVTGCYRGCPYCYASRIANRFSGCNENKLRAVVNGGRVVYEADEAMERTTKNGFIMPAPYPMGFAPTLHHYRIADPQQWKTPRTIFVCSMGDLFAEYIPDEWITEVFDACENAQQHRYMFLTKNPGRYIELFQKGLMPDEARMKNKWFGTTITTQDDPYFFVDEEQLGYPFNGFLSIEPIHGDFQENLQLKEHGIKWVVIGAETGNRTGKVKPEREWVEHITESCDKCGVPVFMKGSVWDVVPDRIKADYPW